MSKSYKVIQYSSQASDNPGIAAGMWAVVEIEERDIGYFNCRADADRIKGVMERSPQPKP